MHASKAWRALAIAAATATLASPLLADAADNAKKMTEAKEVFQQLITATDKEVPKELLEKARCVAVIPNVFKAALGYGVRHGKGVMSCRTANGWSAPSFVNINGGSVGFQLGAESTDLVLFFMNDNGVHSLINGSKITLGGKASVAAGPFGRSGEAATNLELKAEIYSYARSKGLFAGVSVEGAKLAPDNEDNFEYYGKGVNANRLLFGKGAPVTVPAEAEAFRTALP
jgi:lipid-binding SYLF domain-containing protein